MSVAGPAAGAGSMYQFPQQTLMSQQAQAAQAMMMAAQQQGGFQQQHAALYSLQQQQQLRQLQQQQLGAPAAAAAGRKRKLPSTALCIKDGQVYTKPFTQLPQSLVNNNKSEKPAAAMFGLGQPPHHLQQQQVYQASVQHRVPGLGQMSANPYNPLSSYPAHPSQPSYPSYPGQPRPQGPYQHQAPQPPRQAAALDQLYQRIGQKIPGRDAEDSNSVDNEDYQSDEYDDEVSMNEVRKYDDHSEEINEDDKEIYQSDDDDIQSCGDQDDNHDNVEGVQVQQEQEQSRLDEVAGNGGKSSHNNVEMLHDDVEDSSDNHLSNDVEDSSNDNDGPKVSNEPVISSEESSRSQSPHHSDSESASVHPGDMNSGITIVIL